VCVCPCARACVSVCRVIRVMRPELLRVGCSGQVANHGAPVTHNHDTVRHAHKNHTVWHAHTNHTVSA
jgi:hypothetical protein